MEATKQQWYFYLETYIKEGKAKWSRVCRSEDNNLEKTIEYWYRGGEKTETPTGGVFKYKKISEERFNRGKL